MKLHRRRFLHLAAGGAALPVMSQRASALDYPNRPVRIIVGFAAGSTTDILARLMGQWLSIRFGQQFVIENHPGAGGNVGAEAVVNAPADGYTLLMVRVPNVVEVNPSVPVKTSPELIAYAKANPGKLSFASAGIGTASHLAGQLFNRMTGANLQHVPYRGDGPAMADLIAGQVQVGLRP